MAFRIVCLKAACTAAVVVLLLAACLPSTPQAIHRPVQLDEVPGEAHMHQTDIAVGADGTKYVVWTYCYHRADYTACSLRLAIGKTADIQDFQVIEINGEGEGHSYESPDIAVTSDGLVYLVYQAVEISLSDIAANTEDVIARHCYTIIDPANPGEPTCTNLLSALEADNYIPVDAPRVATNGWDVFAIYALGPTGISGKPTKSRLAYQRIHGGYLGGVLTEGHQSDFMHPNLTVSNRGRFYITWFEASAPPYNTPWFNFGCFSPLSSPYQIVYPGPAVNDVPDVESSPAIVMSPDDSQVLVAFSTGTNIKTIHYPSSCEGNGTVDAYLPTGYPWEISGSPSIAAYSANGSKSVTAFSASDDHQDLEIWFKRFGFSPQQKTFNDWEDLHPKLAHIEDAEGSHIVSLGWRTVESDSRSYYRDLYFIPMLDRSVPLHVHSGFTRNGTFEMESNGQWIGAVWIDEGPTAEYNPGGEPWYDVPWVSFNSFELLLPQMRK